MGEIIIIHRDGTETRLQNKEATSKITRAEQRKQLLGEDVLNLTIQSSNPIPVEIGDRIQIFGSVYTVNQLPTISKTGTRTFEQTIILEGTQYELIDVQFILPGDTMYDNLTGDINIFLDVLIQNANRIYPGKWVKGSVPIGTETKTLSFTEKNCLEVLQTLCDEYKTEFEILTSETGVRTIHIKQVGVQFPAAFTYGRTGGLYQLTRQNVNNKNVVTRLYVYGSTKNLGNSYRNSRLCLPGKPKNSSYIEDAGAVALYGTKENTKVFNDIFPARYGSVTGLGTEKFIFYDTSMDFDLNEKDIDGNTIYLIPDVSAKVRFTTGNLAGYEFDIHSYNHATKEIQIVPFVDESGYKFPSDTSSAFQIAVGDIYHFVDINLPATYITAAETKLETEGTEYYNQYKQPQVSYSLAIHPRFLEKYVGSPAAIPNIFALGDQIHIIDSDIGVDKNLRITAFTRDAIDPYKYTLTLSEAAYSKTILNRIISDIDDITDIIEMNNLADPFKARRNWMAAQELLNKIFDPEGYYYSEKIKPLSIETMMLQVGAKSQQFILQNTLFEPNYLADPNAINITGGQLIHYTIDAAAIKTWNLTGGLITALTPSESYFVYAKCDVTGTNGIIIINSAQIKVDQDPMYYHFIIGHLSSVITNPDLSNPARILSLTYGSTTINGRFIRTGRIESSGGGATYFDLDAGIIGGNIRFLHKGTDTVLDTWANNTEQSVTTAQTAANNAQALATTANNLLADIASDSKLTPVEKTSVRKEWDIIAAEVPVNDSQATAFGITTEKTTYDNNFQALATYLNNGVAWSSGVPSWISDANLSVTTNIVGDTFRANWKAYYDARTALLNAIAAKAKTLADEAQGTANIAKAITDKFGTTIDGGLINTVTMLLREAGSTKNTAGISGIQGTNFDQPAIWAGGTDVQAIGLIEFLYNMSVGTPAGTGTGQFDYATKYAQLAKITMLHNGAGKYGDFIVLGNGVIIMIDPATGQQRVMFSVQDLPLLSTLLSTTNPSGSAANIGVNTTINEVWLPESIVVTTDGSTITFITDGGLAVNNYKLSADFSPNANANSIIYGKVNLYKDGILYSNIVTVNIATPFSHSVSIGINKTFTNCPAGTYSVELEWVWGSDPDPEITNIKHSIGATTLSWSFIQTGVRRFQFGKNGFMAFYSLLHLYLSETEGLDIKGKTNMPGVLLSATVASGGGWSAVWGAKQSTTAAKKNSLGNYTVYHTIGHVNYQVYASAHTASRSHHIVSKGTTSFVIEWRTIGSTPALVDTTFDVEVVGNNYS